MVKGNSVKSYVLVVFLQTRKLHPEPLQEFLGSEQTASKA